MRPWSRTETSLFLSLCGTHNNNWSFISRKLGRTPKECHDRYLKLHPGFGRPRNFQRPS
ncbi:40011_t:CDS:2 [Gigaspora margarita]|uniref:40011_t:CDS:1 n=1 Tax=Gigaspora margarita TaxID=4874 RepID=A0ABN7UVP7_GIGMA|nr:40011_t:CDS:2 [Gigaspora margarita]